VPKTYDWTALANVWASQMGSPNSVAKYKAGIMALTSSPTALAAQPDAINRYLSGIQESVSSGRRAAALNKVSLGEYQALATAGAANLGTGAQRKKAKWAAAMQPYGAVYASIQSQLAGMPKGGESAAVARAAVAIHALMAAAGKA